MKKDWRERELTMEVMVGAFLVMVFLGLGYFTIILSKEALFRKTSEMQVTFSDVMGLRVGDNVVVRGMPIGKVKTLELQESGKNCAGVCTTLSLDKPLEMHDGYSVTIVTTSILGGRQLEIDTGPGEAPVIKLDRYRGEKPYDLMGDAAQIVNAARVEIIEGKVFEKVRNVVDQVDQVVTRVNSGQGLLGKVLSDDETVYRDVQASAASLREIMQRLQKGEGLLGKVLSDDETIYRDLQASAASLRDIMQRLQDGEGAIGKLLSGDSTIYNDLAATIESARQVAERLNRGEGTLGRLLTDDTLYNELESTVGEVRAAVDDFRETAPVTTFSSIFFGAF